MPLACLRFPLVEKFEQGFWRHRARMFKLTVLLTDYELASTFQYCQRRDSFLHRYLKVFHQILILVSFADVHVHHFVTRCQNRSQIRPLERHIEHVTVVTPVRTKDDEHALVVFSSFFLSFFDLGTRIHVCGIDVLILIDGLFQVCCASTLEVQQMPLFPLLLPDLRLGHIEGLLFRRLPGAHLSLKRDYLHGRLRGIGLDNIDVHVSCFQADPEIDFGVGSVLISRRCDLCRRTGAVEHLESYRVSPKHRILPLLEWSESSISVLCGSGGLGQSTHPSGEQYNAKGSPEPGITIQSGYVLSSQRPQGAKARYFCGPPAVPFGSAQWQLLQPFLPEPVPQSHLPDYHSSRKWRPVSRTKTSSRLACRVV